MSPIIGQAVRSNDLPMARQRAHDLVGALATVGATVAAKHARDIERACLAGQAPGSALLAALREDFRLLGQAASALFKPEARDA